MRFVLDHVLMLVAATLLLGGLVVASWTSDGDDGERLARLGRLQRFVATTRTAAAQRDEATSQTGLLLAHDEPAELGLAAAGALLGEPRRARNLIEDLCEPDAGWRRAAMRPVLDPIVQALRRAAGGRGRLPIGVSWPFQILLVAWHDAGDRRAWSEQVELWLVMHALLEHGKSGPNQFGVAFWNDERLLALDPAALQQLAAALARLDANAPLVGDPALALANHVQDLLARSHRTTLRGRLGAWRHGFDPRERELAAADELLAALPVLQSDTVDWASRELQWQRFFGAARSGTGAWLLRALGGMRQHEVALRRDLAQLRLLRLAIAWRLGESLPDLLDPFTLTTMLVEQRGEAATFRSPSTQPGLVRHATRAFLGDGRR